MYLYPICFIVLHLLFLHMLLPKVQGNSDPILKIVQRIVIKTEK